jgi:hypothetical protein
MGTIDRLFIMLRRLSVTELAANLVVVLVAAWVLVELWQAMHAP